MWLVSVVGVGMVGGGEWQTETAENEIEIKSKTDIFSEFGFI